MDAYQQFVEEEKKRRMSRGARGRFAADVESLIERAMDYAQKRDKLTLIRRQIIELAIREYWGRKLGEQESD